MFYPYNIVYYIIACNGFTCFALTNPLAKTIIINTSPTSCKGAACCTRYSINYYLIAKRGGIVSGSKESDIAFITSVSVKRPLFFVLIMDFNIIVEF